MILTIISIILILAFIYIGLTSAQTSNNGLTSDHTINKKYYLRRDDYIWVDKRDGLYMPNAWASVERGHVKLYRIVALRDFADVKKGEKGGHIESEYNLSHDGDCWVYGPKVNLNEAYTVILDEADSVIYGNARVYGNAKVHGRVGDNAHVFGDAKICMNPRFSYCISGNAKIYGNAEIYDFVHIYGNAQVYGNAKIYGSTIIADESEVYENATIGTQFSEIGDPCIEGKAQVYGNATILGESYIDDISKVYGNATIINSSIHGASKIYGNAVVSKRSFISDTEICDNIRIVDSYK